MEILLEKNERMPNLKKMFLIVFFALSTHTLHGTQLQNDPAARNIVKKCIRMYGNLKTYQEKLRVRMSMEYRNSKIINTGGVINNVIDISIAKPNRLRFWQSGEFSIVGTSLVCDGKRIWEYMPMWNKFTNDEAPEKLKEIADSDDFLFNAQYKGMEADFVISMLFDPEAAQKNLDNYPVVAFANGNDARSENLRHVVLTRNSEDSDHIVDVWINSKAFLIQRVKDTEIRTITMKGITLKHETVDEYFHNNIRINQPIFPETFRFTPPPGAVETFNLFDSFPVPEKRDTPEAFLEGKAAPDIKLPGMKQGIVYNPAGMKGQTNVLFVFVGKKFDTSNNIGNHVRILGKLMGEFSKKKVSFIGVSMKSTREETATAIRKIGPNMPMAMDPHGSLSTAFHFNGITPPFWVIIDKSGVVKNIFAGTYSRQKQIIAHRLNSLL